MLSDSQTSETTGIGKPRVSRETVNNVSCGPGGGAIPVVLAKRPFVCDGRISLLSLRIGNKNYNLYLGFLAGFRPNLAPRPL